VTPAEQDTRPRVLTRRRGPGSASPVPSQLACAQRADTATEGTPASIRQLPLWHDAPFASAWDDHGHSQMTIANSESRVFGGSCSIGAPIVRVTMRSAAPAACSSTEGTRPIEGS
jgi:hypothetical protein